MAVIAVSYHKSVNVLQEANMAAVGPFDSWQWFRFLSEDSENNLLFCVATEGDAMAALPLRQSAGRLDALTNWYAFAWRPLRTHGAELPPLAEAMARDLKSHARRIVLAPLPDEDGTASLLEKAFRQAGWIVFRDPYDVNHVLDIGGRSYVEYLATRPGPLRTTLARKAKKVSVDIFLSFEDDVWSSYEEIYAKSWKPAEGDPAFLKRFAQAEGAAGRIRLALACHEGKPVAAQFWTVEHGTAYIHKLAHLPEAGKLSAGTTLTAALMEQVIDRDRVERIDFGTGNDSYKADWMEAVRPRFRLDCHDPRRVASWPHIARGALRRLASRKSAG